MDIYKKESIHALYAVMYTTKLNNETQRTRKEDRQGTRKERGKEAERKKIKEKDTRKSKAAGRKISN